jgi:predicted aspartyl protease
LLLGIALFANGCITSPIPQATTLSEERIRLPTFESLGALFIDVKINGRGPFRLFVDTGTSLVILTPEAAAAGRVTKTGKTAPVATPNGSINQQIAIIHRLESNGLKLKQLLALVTSAEDAAGLRKMYGRFDGFLGFAACKDFVLEMDFPGKQISVIRPGKASYALSQSTTYTEDSPQVNLDVNGSLVPALIDTGSNFTFILPRAESYPTVNAPIKEDFLGGWTIGSTVGRRGEIAQLRGRATLGPVTWINPPLRSQDAGTVGNVGVSALETWKVAFDQHQKRVYFFGPNLERSWKPEPFVEPRFRPGYFAKPEGGALRLLEVDPGMAFSIAGLRVDDLVLTADGQPAANGLPTDTASKVKLRVKRDGEEFDATVILKDELL